MVQQEIAEGVDALDGVRVGEVGREEGRVVGGEEEEGGFGCPELCFFFAIVSMRAMGEGKGREGKGGKMREDIRDIPNRGYYLHNSASVLPSHSVAFRLRDPSSCGRSGG